MSIACSPTSRSHAGLTSRPLLDRQASPEANPYTLKSQASLALHLCCLLGLRRVALVGHADGALLALMAAAAACREGPPPGSCGSGQPEGAISVPAARLVPAMSAQPTAGSVADLDWTWMGSQVGATGQGGWRRSVRAPSSMYSPSAAAGGQGQRPEATAARRLAGLSQQPPQQLA